MLFAIALLHCSSPFLLHLLLHCPSTVSFYSALCHCPSAVPVLFCRILILAVLVWQSLKTTWTSSGRLIQPAERKYNDYFEKCNTLIKNFIKSCSLFFIYCSSDGNTSTTHGPYYPRILLNVVPSAIRRYARSCKSPGSGGASTDTCGQGSTCRCLENAGTGQPGYCYTYL